MEDSIRAPHFLEPIKTSRRIHRCVYLDTETEQVELINGEEIHHLKLGQSVRTRRRSNGSWTKGKWIKFTHAEQIADWLCDAAPAGTTTYVWGHNMSYDFRVCDFIYTMPERGFTTKNPIIENNPFLVEYRKPHGKKRYTRIIFISSTNIYQSSLDSLGKLYGINKGDWASVKDDSEALAEYCQKDVLILREAMEGWMEFIDKNDLGPFAITLASQAFCTWRYRFQPESILIDSDKRALETSRAAYYGGRTECFYIGNTTGQFIYIDVNSMYPSVMLDNLYPTNLVGCADNVPLGTLHRVLLKHLVTADVTLQTDIPAYPLKYKKRLMFPTGRFRTTLSTPELVYALDSGHIKKIHRIAYYERSRLFSEYVDTIYKMRRHFKDVGNDVWAMLCKLLLNTLYGKFAQTGIRFEKVTDSAPFGIGIEREYNARLGEWFTFRHFGNSIQKAEKIPESYNSHPAIAAHVTSYARMELWNVIALAGIDNVYYCDTDSLVINLEGFSRVKCLCDETELGKWAIESYPIEMDIYGPKDYHIGYKEKIKGIKKDAEKISNDIYIQSQWETIKGGIRSAQGLSPKTRKVVKYLRRGYVKGEVLPSGRVRPWCLPNDESRIDSKLRS